jgi:ClpP class serine protease
VEADAEGEMRVVLTRDQMVEMLRVFLPEQANEAKLVDKIKTYINKMVELGFLRKHRKATDVYEVRRIIKALVDADWLSNLDEKLRVYHAHAENL